MEPIHFFPRYSRNGASSRLRIYDYADYLEGAGLATAVHPFFPEEYLTHLYATGSKSHGAAIKALLRRLETLRPLPEKAVLEYELLPFLPWEVERFYLKKARYLVTFDDDVWEKYRNIPLLRHKYDQLIRNAAGAIAANDILFERIKKINPNAIRIPTVVKLGKYAQHPRKFDRFTVVWIGTPVTYSYLEQAAPQLQAMAKAVNFELLVIAETSLRDRAIPGISMRFVDWNETTEGLLLEQSHVGIMPLTDDAFSRGKSAFKLIQYQAAGLPAIASPVGENRNVIADGINGFLANTPTEWANALTRLANDRKLYRKLAANAEKRRYDWSFEKYAPVFRDFAVQALQLH